MRELREGKNPIWIFNRYKLYSFNGGIDYAKLFIFYALMVNGSC